MTRYANGYTDVRSGESYGRNGVKNPIPGSGNGGIRGIGGVKGNTHKEKSGRSAATRTEATTGRRSK